jgi:hypothetical protein
MFIDENRASTTPRQMSTEEQRQAGMAPEMHCEGRL